MQKLRKRRDYDLMHLFAFISALTQLSEQLVRRVALAVRLARHVYLHDVALMRRGTARGAFGSLSPGSTTAISPSKRSIIILIRSLRNR